jgi:hypothetical protein
MGVIKQVRAPVASLVQLVSDRYQYFSLKSMPNPLVLMGPPLDIPVKSGDPPTAKSAEALPNAGMGPGVEYAIPAGPSAEPKKKIATDSKDSPANANNDEPNNKTMHQIQRKKIHDQERKVKKASQSLQAATGSDPLQVNAFPGANSQPTLIAPTAATSTPNSFNAPEAASSSTATSSDNLASDSPSGPDPEEAILQMMSGPEDIYTLDTVPPILAKWGLKAPLTVNNTHHGDFARFIEDNNDIAWAVLCDTLGHDPITRALERQAAGRDGAGPSGLTIILDADSENTETRGRPSN